MLFAFLPYEAPIIFSICPPVTFIVEVPINVFNGYAQDVGL